MCNALVYASGDGNAKSPPLIRSRVDEERGMALAAAVSPLAAENRGGESGLHGDAIFLFLGLSLCENFHLLHTYLLVIFTVPTYCKYGSIEGSTG